MITIEFTTDNAAFGETDLDTLREAAHVLRSTANNLTYQAEIQNDSDCTLTKMIEPIKDVNGNTIGTLTYTKDLFHQPDTDVGARFQSWTLD